MQKKVTVVLVAILFIVVGLCGCTNNDDDVVSVSAISEIIQHPNRYVNTEVTIRGYYSMRILKEVVDGEFVWVYSISDESGFNAILGYVAEGIDESILIQGGEYYWTGMIIQMGDIIRMEISGIQPI